MRKSFKRKSGKRGPVVEQRRYRMTGSTLLRVLRALYVYGFKKRIRLKLSTKEKRLCCIAGFHFENEVYERQANGKGDYKNRGCKRILPIKYTPDFIGDTFIIETKGRANESFPMRWKLFKRLIVEAISSDNIV